MRKSTWLAATLLATLLLGSLVWAAERMRASEIKGLVSGELIIRPDTNNAWRPGHSDLMNPIPISLDGYPTGYAFAPGCPELAYSAIELQDGKPITVVRIAKVLNLWPVERKRPKLVTNQRTGQQISVMENVQETLPFIQRERKLLALPVTKTKRDILVSPFIEGPIAWSPDGTKIAIFAVTENAKKSYASRDIWLIDYTTGTRQALTQGAWVTDLSWSPDSRWLTYAVERAEKKLAPPAQPTAPGLWMADMKTGAKVKVAAGGIDLQWDKESHSLRFRRDGDDPGVEYQLATGKIVSAPLPAQVEYPWQTSPDGRFRATLEKQGDATLLMVRERVSGVQRLSLPAQEFGCWNPDSKVLTFFDGQGQLCMTSIEGIHRGHGAEITNKAELMMLPFQPPVQWSSFALPAGLETKPQVGNSWLAFLAQGQLRVLRLQHGLPGPHDRAVMGMTPEKERELVHNNLKQVALAVIMYAGDWDFEAPPGNFTFPRAVSPYLKSMELLDRPGYPGDVVFKYLVTDPKAFPKLKSPAEVPMGIIDYFADGGYVAYADGHVTWVPREEIAALLQKTQEAYNPKK